jgi:hypothetical protein
MQQIIFYSDVAQALEIGYIKDETIYLIRHIRSNKQDKHN